MPMKDADAEERRLLNQPYAQRLKCAIRNAGLTYGALAEMIGSTEGTVSRWCRGSGLPNMREFADICDAIGVAPHEMLGLPPHLGLGPWLLDNGLADKILSTTNPRQLSDLLSWEQPPALVAVRVPESYSESTRREAQALAEKVEAHIEAHAPGLLDKWHRGIRE